MVNQVCFLVLLIFAVCFTSSAAPVDKNFELHEPEDAEKTYYELQELKRVVRQCPFSGGFGGAGGAGGPDLNQMLTIARTILSALDGGNAGGFGGANAGGFGGSIGGNSGVDTNQIARMMRRRF